MNAHTPPPFSVVIVARNEAQTLPRLARSLARFLKRGGDAVIVDTGSTDDTVSVAKAFGFRVERARGRFHTRLTPAQADEINTRFAVKGEGPLVRPRTRMFHFGRAREYAASRANHDIVFHLDASDTVRALDTDFLERAIVMGAARRFGYWRELSSRQNPGDVLAFRIGWFYDRRLWQWEGMCHEVLVPRTLEADAARPVEVERDRLLVRHLKQQEKKREHYLPALALDALAEPANPRRQHYLGRELYYAHHYRSALALLEIHAANHAGWLTERSESLCLVGACHAALGERTDAVRGYERAFALDGSRREPLLRLADMAQSEGDFQACAGYAFAALEIPHTGSYFERTANYTYLPHAFLYWALFWLGRKAEAQKHWEQCLTLLPTDKRFRADAKLFGVTL